MLLLPTLVSAHAEYESSTPAKDEVVTAAPAQIDVFFSQELFRQEGANFVRVFNELDEQVSQGDGIINDDNRRHITAILMPNLPEGRYVVEWQTLSDADGDDDSGAFCFYIIIQPTEQQAAECAALEGDEEPATTPTAGAVDPTAEPTDETPTVIAEPTEAADDDGDGGAPTGAIVGGVIGAIAVAAAVGAAALFFTRRSRS
jgi:methionine-rich copper-binding protein CopC